MYNNPVKDWMYFTRSQQKGIIVLCILIAGMPLLTRWIHKTRQQSSVDTEQIFMEAERFRLYLAGLEKQREQQRQEQRRQASSAAHSTRPSSVRSTYQAQEPLLIHINTTDSIALQKIRGIGPAFGRRIILYRELLGGYHCINQLLEVYGMDSARFESIRAYLETDTVTIRRINVNEASFGDLVRHPYIDRTTANAILNLRTQHGPFSSVEELKRSYLICDKILERIRIYLCTE